MATSRRRSTRKSRAVPAGPVGTLPVPVRLSRVRVALKRIASGYYDREEVRDRLAVAVLEELKQRG